ncbi:MAG: phosphoribosylformylglycinamidine synthase [Bacteroidales bacterium]|jgi:phosphoribosylformylglycinamidine synthase|nr:phosphoribosylformylglycinamidine synthase [Bacteroidales bacterium]
MNYYFQDKDSTVIAFQTEEELGEQSVQKLLWLLEGARLLQPDHPALQVRYKGPRRSLPTPWSTVAVEVCERLGVPGTKRVELFFPLAPDQTYDYMFYEVYEGLKEPLFETGARRESVLSVMDIEAYNRQENLALSLAEVQHLQALSRRLGRPLTDSEVFGFSQVNSEHCRHKIFNGTFIIDGVKQPHSLFDLIKKTSALNPNRIVSAYKDNCAFVRGPGNLPFFVPEKGCEPSFYRTIPHHTVLSLKAETHNFPTTVEPFNGAATGAGGEIRDRMAGGKGSFPIAGTAVYMTAYPGALERRPVAKQWPYHSPEEILTRASDGASSYGNKFGHPLICGSLLCFEHVEGSYNLGYDKVIMQAGGVGFARLEDAHKGVPEKGDKVVLLGGDNYRIGMGGGAGSSVATGQMDHSMEMNAVQRSNPEMQKRVYNTIRALAESGKNPIVSIHDHGAGGHLNCLSELVEDVGGRFDLEQFPIGDPTLSAKEIIGNESQERMGLVVKEEDLPLLQCVAKREQAPLYVVGEVTGDNRLIFENKAAGEVPIDLELKDLLGSLPETVMEDVTHDYAFQPLDYQQDNVSLLQYAERVMQLESVACKDWIVNKVDRSVSGLVAGQQTVGELQLPLNDYGLMALSLAPSPTGHAGVATSVGHAPVSALIDPAAGSRLAIAEALTNLVFVELEDGLQGVSLSANWMWPCKHKGEDARLYRAVQSASDFASALGINIPTGKDSLSMTQKYPDGSAVKAPGTVIISTVAPVPDVRSKVQPVLDTKQDSVLIYIDFSGALGKERQLGGSALAQCLGKVGTHCPDVHDPQMFQRGFATVQEMIKKGMVLAGHDVSAGGLLTCLLEMCFANVQGGIQLRKHVLDQIAPADPVGALFSEYPGVVVQVPVEHAHEALGMLLANNVVSYLLGTPSAGRYLTVDDTLSFDIDRLRNLWYNPSYLMDKRQSHPEKALERYNHYGTLPLTYQFPKLFTGQIEPEQTVRQETPSGASAQQPIAAVIREKGSQSEREMAWMLHLAGFKVRDVHMEDLISGTETLDTVKLIVFAGGSAHADVFGSAKGWAGAFLYNRKAKDALERFYAREDTLSLGVCNGCQLMMHLGLVTSCNVESSPKMMPNDSGKFECSFVNVEVEESPSIFLKGLEGSRLGSWIAHGEGKFHFPKDTLERTEHYRVAMRYSYDAYPANPNGSPGRVAAVTSACGRHLAMMPHPERSLYPWNWGYYPPERWADDISPWLSLFTEALKFCNE